MIRDAQALKALFTDPGAQAAIKEIEEHRFSDMTVDLGKGPEEFSVTRMPSGDFRIVNGNDPGLVQSIKMSFTTRRQPWPRTFPRGITIRSSRM